MQVAVSRDVYVQATLEMLDIIDKAVLEKGLKPSHCSREQILDAVEFLLEYMNVIDLCTIVDSYMLDYSLKQFTFGSASEPEKKFSLKNWFSTNILRKERVQA
jgi:hypothetical protein